MQAVRPVWLNGRVFVYKLSGCEFEVEFESRFNPRENLKNKICLECI